MPLKVSRYGAVLSVYSTVDPGCANAFGTVSVLMTPVGIPTPTPLTMYWSRSISYTSIDTGLLPVSCVTRDQLMLTVQRLLVLSQLLAVRPSGGVFGASGATWKLTGACGVPPVPLWPCCAGVGALIASLRVLVVL